ncbi:MAG: cation diffusion facilitator family transporter [Acidimicrobiia bacterium]
MATESRTAVIAALIANALIAVGKFVAVAITGSAAMLAEGFHSVADTGNQLFLLRGLAVSRYRPSVRYPFGRGKEVYFWSFMVAVMLFVGGAVLSFQEGLARLRHPEEIESYTVSFVVLGLAMLFETPAFLLALRAFNERRGSRGIWEHVRESKDTTLIVVLFEDSAALVGLTIAATALLLARLTGQPRWDGAASVVIAFLLVSVAFMLAFETKGLLVGEGASRRDRAAIRAAALGVPEVAGLGRVLTMHLGPEEILVNLEVSLDSRVGGAEVLDRVEAAIREAVPEATRIFVEIDSEEG